MTQNKDYEQLEKLNRYYKQIIQSALDWGRIYKFQKKKLKELGFRV